MIQVQPAVNALLKIPRTLHRKQSLGLVVMNVRTGFTKIVWLLKAVTLKGHGIATVAFRNLSANHVFLLNHQTKQMRKCYGLPVTDVKAGTIRCV
jgi:hypothetical protein